MIKFTIPDSCPICNHIATETGSFLYCRNPSCPAKAKGAIKVWIARLGLLHWGDAFVDSLADESGPVKSIADLYRLSVEELAFHTSGVKMAKKCYDILHASKSLKLEVVLSGLNIPNLGLSTATDIVSAGYDTVEKLSALTPELLDGVPNIGPVLAESLYDGINERLPDLRALSQVLDIQGPIVGVLSGMSFCITGSTTTPRKRLQTMGANAGGTIKESVSKGLTFLITNEDLSTFTSEKAKKALAYGTKVISESEFLKMLQGVTS